MKKKPAMPPGGGMNLADVKPAVPMPGAPPMMGGAPPMPLLGAGGPPAPKVAPPKKQAPKPPKMKGGQAKPKQKLAKVAAKKGK